MTADADPPEVLELFHANLGLVERVAAGVGATMGAGLERDELRAAGREGLLDAARRFDASRGVPFPAYATIRVRGAMIDAVRKLAALPRRAWERVRALEAAHRVSEGAAEDALGARAPGSGPAEAEAALGEHLAAMATAIAMGLLVAGDGTVEQAERQPTPEDELIRRQLADQLRDATADLPEPERELVRRHYFGGERFDHVAAELGLSKSWASRLHTRALKRLARRLQSPGR